MSVPTNKQELLDAIHTTYRKLRVDLQDIPAEKNRETTLEGHAQGTQMSVSDLVAYLIGWNQLVLKWCAAKAAHQPVDFPETGFKWNELGLLAQKFYQDHASTGYADLLQTLDLAYTHIITLVESQSDEHLYGCAWHEKYTMGRMIQFNTSSPYANARIRIRKWKKANGLPVA